MPLTQKERVETQLRVENETRYVIPPFGYRFHYKISEQLHNGTSVEVQFISGQHGDPTSSYIAELYKALHGDPIIYKYNRKTNHLGENIWVECPIHRAMEERRCKTLAEAENRKKEEEKHKAIELYQNKRKIPVEKILNEKISILEKLGYISESGGNIKFQHNICMANANFKKGKLDIILCVDLFPCTLKNPNPMPEESIIIMESNIFSFHDDPIAPLPHYSFDYFIEIEHTLW